MLGPTTSRPADTTTAASRFRPGAGIGSSPGVNVSAGVSNARFHNSPPEMASSIVATTKQMMTTGSDRVRPYRNERGLSCGAARTNARMVAAGTPARRISRATGMTPSEQTGSSDPMIQARNSPFSPSPPNSFRVPSAPSIRRMTAAPKNPTKSVEDASMAVCPVRSKTLQKMSIIALQ